MTEDKLDGEDNDEVQGILNDLDAILSDLGGEQAAQAAAPVSPMRGSAPVPPPVEKKPESSPAPAAAKPVAAVPPPAPAAKPVAAAPPPAPAAKPVAAAPPPAPVAKPKPTPAIAPAPAPQPQTPAGGGMSIELGPRKFVTAPPEKKAAPAPKPAGLKTQSPLEIKLEPAPKAAAPAPAAQQPPAIAPIPPRGGCKPPDPIPEGATSEKFAKDQIRRVAFFYLVKHIPERDAFVKLLEATAQTLSKKPLFLRRVLYQQVAEESDVKELLSRVREAKAVAILGLLEGLSDGKIREISEACNAAGIMFRGIAHAEVGKKSVAVDVVVDVILLSHE